MRESRWVSNAIIVIECGRVRGGLYIRLQRRDERLLRDIQLAALTLALLAFILFLQQLAFARGVAAVALGGDVLGQKARTVARAITLPPMAAWIGTYDIWSGIGAVGFSRACPPETTDRFLA